MADLRDSFEDPRFFWRQFWSDTNSERFSALLIITDVVRLNLVDTATQEPENLFEIWAGHANPDVPGAGFLGRSFGFRQEGKMINVPEPVFLTADVRLIRLREIGDQKREMHLVLNPNPAASPPKAAQVSSHRRPYFHPIVGGLPSDPVEKSKLQDLLADVPGEDGEIVVGYTFNDDTGRLEISPCTTAFIRRVDPEVLQELPEEEERVGETRREETPLRDIDVELRMLGQTNEARPLDLNENTRGARGELVLTVKPPHARAFSKMNETELRDNLEAIADVIVWSDFHHLHARRILTRMQIQSEHATLSLFSKGSLDAVDSYTLISRLRIFVDHFSTGDHLSVFFEALSRRQKALVIRAFDEVTRKVPSIERFNEVFMLDEGSQTARVGVKKLMDPRAAREQFLISQIINRLALTYRAVTNVRPVFAHVLHNVLIAALREVTDFAVGGDQRLGFDTFAITVGTFDIARLSYGGQFDRHLRLRFQENEAIAERVNLYFGPRGYGALQRNPNLGPEAQQRRIETDGLISFLTQTANDLFEIPDREFQRNAQERYANAHLASDDVLEGDGAGPGAFPHRTTQEPEGWLLQVFLLRAERLGGTADPNRIKVSQAHRLATDYKTIDATRETWIGAELPFTEDPLEFGLRVLVSKSPYENATDNDRLSIPIPDPVPVLDAILPAQNRDDQLGDWLLAEFPPVVLLLSQDDLGKLTRFLTADQTPTGGFAERLSNEMYTASVHTDDLDSLATCPTADQKAKIKELFQCNDRSEFGLLCAELAENLDGGVEALQEAAELFGKIRTDFDKMNGLVKNIPNWVVTPLPGLGQVDLQTETMKALPSYNFAMLGQFAQAAATGADIPAKLVAVQLLSQPEASKPGRRRYKLDREDWLELLGYLDKVGNPPLMSNSRPITLPLKTLLTLLPTPATTASAKPSQRDLEAVLKRFFKQQFATPAILEKFKDDPEEFWCLVIELLRRFNTETATSHDVIYSNWFTEMSS